MWIGAVMVVPDKRTMSRRRRVIIDNMKADVDKADAIDAFREYV
jgi:hypothetical protein